MSKKLTIEEMREIARKKGGKCLSEKYINIDTKLKWRCKKGHIWMTTPYIIKTGHWCPQCSYKRIAQEKKATILEMQEIARKRGGKCLSEEYVDDRTKLMWQCKNGHAWESSPNNIKSGGHWCPICTGRGMTIKDMKKLARERGGKCLSKIYINSVTKLKWQCKEKHIWKATPSDIKIGHWCHRCAIIRGALKRKSTIQEMREIAEDMGGLCLSKKYISSQTKLKWRCKNGHEWEARPNSVKRGMWCPACAGNKPLTIKDIKEIAKERGGKCLSKKYVNSATKLKWQCKEGHIWEATPNNISRGKWCAICSAGISERICRALFENIFKNKFPKANPKWLINSRGNRMELDGYCQKLRLAFEYHGKQHYSTVKFFGGGNKLNQRMKDDKLKGKLCRENNVTLIEIPYKIQHGQMYDFIINKCIKKNIKIPKHRKKEILNLNISLPDKLIEMSIIAENRGGKCLSRRYIDINTNLT